VFAANDMMAIGCLAALGEAGLRVPEDIALAGFDDIPIARYVAPALTTIRVPIAALGAARWTRWSRTSSARHRAPPHHRAAGGAGGAPLLRRRPAAAARNRRRTPPRTDANPDPGPSPRPATPGPTQACNPKEIDT
jgi:hypothetical protein